MSEEMNTVDEINQPVPEQPTTESETTPVVESPDERLEQPEKKTDEKPDSEKDINELPLPEEEDESDETIYRKSLTERLQRKDKQIEKIRAEAAAKEQALLRYQQMLQEQQLSEVRPPHRDDFETEGEFISATVDYEIQKRQQQQIHHERKVRQEEEHRKLEARKSEVIDSGQSKYPDFEEVRENLKDVPANEAMLMAVLKSEYAPDILYFLGKNHNHAKQVALMEPIEAIKKIYELENRFKEARKNKKAQVTAFSPPVNLKSQPGVSKEPTMTDLEKMPQDQFEKYLREKSKRKTI